MSNLFRPYHVREDTLAFFKEQPLFLAQSMREVSVPQAASTIKGYLTTCGLRQPEAEAIAFYTGNAVFAEVLKRFALDEPLPAEVLTLVQWYVKNASVASQRLLYYLLLIITREARHVYTGIYPKLQEKHGGTFLSFNKSCHGMGSEGCASHFVKNPPGMKLGAYTDATAYVFHGGHFGHNFGGSTWAAIADVFKGYVDGKLSPEMATDVSWALCHNNGPIFNKEMTYSLYDKYQITRVLDVQRSGQMIEFVLTDPVMQNGVWVYNPVRKVAEAAKAMWPSAFGDSVDWYKVEQAGSEQTYGALKLKQVAKAMPNVKQYWVTPEKWVPIVERKKAA